MKKLICLCLAVLTILCMTACGSAPADDVKVNPVQKNVADIYTELGAAVTLPEMLPVGTGMLSAFCGIEASFVKQVSVYICSDSLKTDEYWLIEAADEASAKKIVDLAKARLKTKGDESIT